MQFKLKANRFFLEGSWLMTSNAYGKMPGNKMKNMNSDRKSGRELTLVYL